MYPTSQKAPSSRIFFRDDNSQSVDDRIRNIQKIQDHIREEMMQTNFSQPNPYFLPTPEREEPSCEQTSVSSIAQGKMEDDNYMCSFVQHSFSPGIDRGQTRVNRTSLIRNCDSRTAFTQTDSLETTERGVTTDPEGSLPSRSCTHIASIARIGEGVPRESFEEVSSLLMASQSEVRSLRRDIQTEKTANAKLAQYVLALQRKVSEIRAESCEWKNRERQKFLLQKRHLLDELHSKEHFHNSSHTSTFGETDILRKAVEVMAGPSQSRSEDPLSVLVSAISHVSTTSQQNRNLIASFEHRDSVNKEIIGEKSTSIESLQLQLAALQRKIDHLNGRQLFHGAELDQKDNEIRSLQDALRRSHVIMSTSAAQSGAT